MNAASHIEFSRRKVRNLGVDARIFPEEIISHFRLQEIHIHVEIVIDRSDVAPVGIHLVAVNPLDIFVSDQDVLNDVVASFLLASLKELNQGPSSNDIDPARNNIRLRNNRLFHKIVYYIYIKTKS